MAIEDAAAKLRAFARILKLGHDLFNAADFADAAVRAVNDSKVVINYRSAALFEYDGKDFELLAQSGIPEKNPRSKLVLDQIEMLKTLDVSLPLSVIDRGLPGEAEKERTVYLAANLPCPEVLDGTVVRFIWLLEFSGEVSGNVENLVKVVAGSVGEALYFHRFCGRGKRLRKRGTGRKIFWLTVLLIFIASMFIRVPESATAEFTLRPQDSSVIYAPFDGTILHCLRQDGESVAKGDIIAKYDTAVLQYRLDQARSQLAELETEIALEERSAFFDPEKLGKVRLLAASRKIIEVTVAEAEWFIGHSTVTAPADGVLVLADGRAEKLAGKAVRSGERIAEIYGGSGVIAEIPVDEKQSSILQNDFSVSLYLHTAPENAIPVTVDKVAAYPEFTEQKTWCYTVRCALPDNSETLRYGMRGVAKLSGGKVFLGYRLIKSAILYFRGL